MSQTPYDESEELLEYVLQHGDALFTEQEAAAKRWLLMSRKIEHSSNERSIRMLTQRRFLCESSIGNILDQGEQVFLERLRDRIDKEHPEFFNFCANCKKLARTPVAKQCRWCGHDWHHEMA